MATLLPFILEFKRKLEGTDPVDIKNIAVNKALTIRILFCI
jgi:hypothetical protein